MTLGDGLYSNTTVLDTVVGLVEEVDVVMSLAGGGCVSCSNSSGTFVLVDPNAGVTALLLLVVVVVEVVVVVGGPSGVLGGFCGGGGRNVADLPVLHTLG